MSVPVQPTKLEMIAPNLLAIEWSDGERRQYTLRELRDRCPCATCREKRQKPPAPPNPLQVLSPAEARPLHQEFVVADFVRSFILSDEVDHERITATMTNGVLKVMLPKAAKAKPRRIEVNADPQQ